MLVLSLIGVFLAMVATLMLAGQNTTAFFGTVVVDNFAIFFKVIFLLAAGLVLLSAENLIERVGENAAEFCGLILFCTAGLMFMASSYELMTIYLVAGDLQPLAGVPGGLEQARAAVQRGRPQVLRAERRLVGHPAVRHGADVRHHRQHQPARDRPGPDHADGPAGRAAGDVDAGGRLRLQDRGGAVPDVDAGRLRGRPDPDHGVHVGRLEGGRLRGGDADLRRGARRRRDPGGLGRPVRGALAAHDDGRATWRRCSRPT